MTQPDTRSRTTTASPASTGGVPQNEKPRFNWRISVGMAIGLVVLFGVLFGLRALHIFPPEPGEDPQIVAVRATLAALPTQPAVAAQPTPTPASAGPAVATSASVPTNVATPAPTQPPAAAAQNPVPSGAVFETAPTPIATSTANGAASPSATGTSASSSAPIEATAEANATSPVVQPTPVAVNLPANLANAILQGYANYWTVRVNAIRDPSDASIDLGTVMAGNELLGAQKTLAQYRDAGEAFDSNVKHTVWITSATSDHAVIVDQFTATTLRVDRDTKAPLDATPSVETRTDTFELQLLDGTWKVVDEP